MKYKEGYEEYGANVKQKKLLDSIESSNKILKGDSSYEAEKSKFDKKTMKNLQEKESFEIKNKKISKIKPKFLRKPIENISESSKTKEKEQVIERKITRLLQRTINSTKKPQEKDQNPKKNQKEIKEIKDNKEIIENKDNKENKENMEFEKLPVLKESEIKKIEETIEKKTEEKTAEKIEEEPVFPISEQIFTENKSKETPELTISSEKEPNFNKILKDLWLFLDTSKDDLEYKSEIKEIKRNLRLFLSKISSEFSLMKKNDVKNYEVFQIYTKGYGNLLSTMDYILKNRQNSFIYKCYFECIHQDLSVLYEEFKAFIYENYLKPDLPQRKNSKNTSSFEFYKENSTEKKGKLSEEFEENSENQTVVFKKKFCLNMAKALQSIYNINKENSQQYSLKIHALLIKTDNSERYSVYQSNGIKLLKILKVVLWFFEEIH